MNLSVTAKELAELIASELKSCNDLEKRIIIRQILEYIGFGYFVFNPLSPNFVQKSQDHHACTTHIIAMSDAESRHFETTLIPFGMFKGKPWKDVPLSTIVWYADSQRETWIQLYRYLKSPRIVAEQEQTEG